jgi:hypothetical protein
MGDQNEAAYRNPRMPSAVRPAFPAIDVVREGQPKGFLNSRPTRSSATAQWADIALEFSTSSALFPRSTLHLKTPANADGFLRGN